ncbi:glycerophosphodiester phosphodiesterase family protein [Poriferisphaera sp. WC338]|uniref:glycerophosphodiester phosphodiesterase family protein n=1 Tax=Poriferisphaera sp. WC338 TaxID=3425129 RepID=UPI003D81B9C0
MGQQRSDLLFVLILIVLGMGLPHEQVVAKETDRVDLIRAYLLDANKGGCLVVAHRGHHKDWPENSVRSIEAAAEAGIHMVELDVRQTADGEYVLMHDKTVDRTTNGKGELAKMTYAALRRLQLKHAERPTGLVIPRYAEALAAARGKVMINVDLKSGSLRDVVEIARKMGVLDHCLFKANYKDVADEEMTWLQAQEGVVFMPIVYSLDEAQEAAGDGQFKAIEVVVKGSTRGGFTEGVIRRFQAKGVRVWINTLWNGRLFAGMGDEQAVRKPSKVYSKLAHDGVGMIQTDLPELAIKTMREDGVLVP